jgi:glycine/D-amino acid oxidase-like deaminating enzyme
LTYRQCQSRIEYKELIASAPIPPECQRQYDQYIANKRDEAAQRERDAAQREREAAQLRRAREQREDAERRARNQKIEDGVRDLKGLIPRLKRRP